MNLNSYEEPFFSFKATFIYQTFHCTTICVPLYKLSVSLHILKNSQVVTHLSPQGQVFLPDRTGEPRPVLHDDDPARQQIAASALVLPPGTVSQYLCVWEQDISFKNKAGGV